MPKDKMEKLEEFDDKMDEELLGESLDKVFGAEQSAQQHTSKELFSPDKIKLRTDISAKLCSKIARAYYLFDLIKMEKGKILLDTFLELRVSKDRLSRKEFVQSLQSQLENDIKKGQNDMRGQFK